LKGNNLSLIREAHRLAFAIAILFSKIPNRKPFVKPYFSQPLSDSIQMISAMALGNKRTAKLLERAVIEDLLRYIYYYHHEIEHKLLQLEPNKYETIKSLFEYAGTHPFFRDDSELKASLSVLQSKYSELSKEIHVSTTSRMTIIKDIISVNKPVADADELNNLKTISQYVVFLLCHFHKDKYAKLSLDEKALLVQFLNKKQKRKLCNLL
jgi:hypothetical protein